MRKRPRLRLVPHYEGTGFQWYSYKFSDDLEIGDPLFIIWTTEHDTRDGAIDYYNKVLEDFNAESN